MLQYCVFSCLSMYIHLISLYGKKKYQNTDNTKIGKLKLNSYQKTEEICGWKAHTNTQKLNWYVLTFTDVFLNQQRVNVHEHTVKMHTCQFQVRGTRVGYYTMPEWAERGKFHWCFSLYHFLFNSCGTQLPVFWIFPISHRQIEAAPSCCVSCFCVYESSSSNNSSSSYFFLHFSIFLVHTFWNAETIIRAYLVVPMSFLKQSVWFSSSFLQMKTKN